MGRSVRARPEVAVVAVVAAALGGWMYGLGWLCAVLVHELGHGLAARASGADAPLMDLQLGAGDVYAPPGLAVLGSGVAASACVLFAVVLADVGSAAFQVAFFHWLLFQATPHPSSDSGVWLRGELTRRGCSERRAFLIVAWGAALSIPCALLACWNGIGPRSVEPLVPWIGLAVLVGVTEWPAVVHLDAWSAWRRKDLDAVVALSFGAGPRFAPVRRLGLRAAVRKGDRDAVEALGARLSVTEPEMLRAAVWLLERDDALGARWAERLIDVMSARAQPDPAAVEVVVEFAMFEARRGAPTSALGLLKTARESGFDRFEWLSYRPEARALSEDPRWQRMASD